MIYMKHGQTHAPFEQIKTSIPKEDLDEDLESEEYSDDDDEEDEVEQPRSSSSIADTVYFGVLLLVGIGICLGVLLMSGSFQTDNQTQESTDDGTNYTIQSDSVSIYGSFSGLFAQFIPLIVIVLVAGIGFSLFTRGID